MNRADATPNANAPAIGFSCSGRRDDGGGSGGGGGDTKLRRPLVCITAMRMCICDYARKRAGAISVRDISLRHKPYNRKPGNFMAAAYSRADFKIALHTKATYSKIVSMQYGFNVVSVRFLYRCNLLLVFYAGKKKFFCRQNLDTIR